ncbi:hypothetical protein LCGC14_1292830 [marine sediment metagenome]|uniref:Uncharacterized protein n=1 Tax=marine sediment metagenome TaxID=412755 RepID=A0A0F9N8E8_9ZZZZ
MNVVQGRLLRADGSRNEYVFALCKDRCRTTIHENLELRTVRIEHDGGPSIAFDQQDMLNEWPVIQQQARAWIERVHRDLLVD